MRPITFVIASVPDRGDARGKNRRLPTYSLLFRFLEQIKEDCQDLAVLYEAVFALLQIEMNCTQPGTRDLPPKGADTMSTREIVHTINNQLTIVMGRAALLASNVEDPGIKSRCREIENAVQTISSLLNRMPKD